MKTLPFLITNFKNHKQSTGKDAQELAKIHNDIQKQTNKKIGICPNNDDLQVATENKNIIIIAQHSDLTSDNGQFSSKKLKEIGVQGSLLNHSDHRLPTEIIKKTIKELHNEDLFVIICAETPKEVEFFQKLNPDAIAFEPKELIGGDISVATAESKSIKECIKNAKNIPLYIGAGIKTKKDIEIGLKLGVKGFLASSNICKSNTKTQKLKELLEIN